MKTHFIWIFNPALFPFYAVAKQVWIYIDQLPPIQPQN